VDLGLLRSVCLSKNGATEEYPFDEYTAVFKVRGKMFALADTREFSAISLKADPEEASRRRERFPAVSPGYHMSKRHWITVEIDGSVADSILRSWIEDSYRLVAQKLPKSERLAILGF
jgi:predicted DNA-binding protein (MmcQ/YjbR family)